MQDAKEEIRSRLAIEDVIGEYVHLKRSGRNFKGLSPFNDEKTPSFMVSPDKNIWHDFSSNKGGDIFTFIMEVEGVDFRQAIEMLGRKAGVDVSQFDDKNAAQRSKLRKRLLEINNLAMKYYQQSLLKNQKALEYVFKNRGISKDMVRAFGIGYAPDSREAVVRFLKKRGYAAKELAQAGLTNRNGGDLLRARVIIPLMDVSGEVIGFTGRIIDDVPNAPKYLNTPQTLLYDKGRHVFALSQAKESIRKSDYAVLVEGNLDVVSSHQSGVKQAVATAGTALTESHLKTLARFTSNIKLAFDGDKAGIAATERAIPIAQKVGVELTIVSLPSDVKDPDELIKKDANLWQQAVDSSSPVVDWLFRQYSQREDMSTARGKRRFTTVALEVVKKITDPVEQEYYIKRIADDTATSIDAVKSKLLNINSEKDLIRLKKTKNQKNNEKDEVAYQDNLLALALYDAGTREAIGAVHVQMLQGDERQKIFEFIKNDTENVTETPKLLQDLDTYVKILILKADTRYGQWSLQDRLLEMTKLVRLTITEHKQKQKEHLTAELRLAEEDGDDERAGELRKQLNELIKEMPRAKR